MTWSNNRTYIRWSLFQRFLSLACIFIFIPLTIAALVIIGLIPVYLSNHSVYITPSTTVSSFNVTYVVVDPSIRLVSELNLNSVDRVKMARSFESSLSLNVRNVLQILNIFPIITIGKNSTSRRKRLSIQCDQGLSGTNGPVLIFEFNLTYPVHRICQNQQCVNEVFAEIYNKFQTVPSLLVDFDNISRELSLCSFGVPSNTIVESSAAVAPLVSNDFTTVSSITNNFPTVTSITHTITPIENSNSTLNEIISDIDVCLKKLPMTQEQVPPYQITHTSTLFFQDDYALIIVGASKFETIIDKQTIKKQIIIDGVMLTTNCQRTIDVSVPILCYFQASS